jgi:chromate transporter
VTARNANEVFAAFFRLGLTSFGGPVAHLGYFREEFVNRRRWVSEEQFGELLALCQFLPGPASSQLAYVLGLLRANWPGAIAAFVGFTLPSAILLTAFAVIGTSISHTQLDVVAHGLKLTAVCVVAQALIGMVRSLTRDAPTRIVAILSAGLVLFVNSSWMQLVAIALGAIALALFHSRINASDAAPLSSVAVPYGRRTGSMLIALYGAALLAAIFAPPTQSTITNAVAAFYRSGALVFGGGHVVLPLLQDTIVRSGLISADDFLSGYGAAQAVPGPMFSIAAFLGARIDGVGGAALCLLAIFVPGFLLISGVLPFWSILRMQTNAQSLMRGANAAVVGILAAALYNPVLTSAIAAPIDILIVLLGSGTLVLTKRSPLWVIVWCIASAAAASLLRQ